jgi:predicted ATP-grasp superfamily ATP-dependent carboligase/protein-tyrosine-phosphatase
MAQSPAHRGVLVLDGTTRAIVTICRSLHSRGIPAICAQLGRRGLSRHSNSVRADVALPTSGGAFLEQLRTLLARYDVDTIVPCSDKALMALLPYYAEITRVAHVTCPDPDVVARVLDKGRTLAAARECGVPIPATYEIADRRALDDLKGSLRFPIIAKPRNVGNPAPFKVAQFNDARELAEFFDWSHFGPFIFQEYVTGDGVGLSTIVAEGRLLTVFAHRRLHEYPPGGGFGVFFESETPNPEIVRASAKLLEQLEWQGPAMVEFRHDARTGNWSLMEVNGRFWGSLPLGVSAGIDFPYLLWQSIHGAPFEVPKTYRAGIRMRFTAGEIARFADLVTSGSERRQLGYRWIDPFAQALQSFRPGVRSALFSITDPLPECIDVSLVVARILASKTWRLARNVLPRPFADRISQLRTLRAEYRKTYLTLWLREALGRGGVGRNGNVKDARRVTMVCRANRIRSPLAAAMFEAEIGRIANANFTIRSAGTQTTPEMAFDPRAEDAARSMGLELSGRPQALNSDLVSDSDLLIVMDRIIEAELLTCFPQAVEKVSFLGSDEVRDPDREAQPEFARFVESLRAKVAQLARSFVQE